MNQFKTSFKMSYLAARLLNNLFGGVGTARSASSTVCHFLYAKNVYNAAHMRTISKWGNQQYQSCVMPFPSAYQAKIFGSPRQALLFHTSPRRNIPPLLVVVLKPIAKAASIITGR